MASGKSNAAVFASIAAAAGLTMAKLVAGVAGGSAAMLASGTHSGVDCCNSLLLYLGQRRSARPGDAQHPFGYGMELYFWTLIVALVIFTVGGLVTITEGVYRLVEPEEVTRPILNCIVFGVAAGFNLFSWVIALRQFLGQSRGRGLAQRLRKAKDPTVLTVLFEDSASLVSVGIAFLGVLLGYLLHLPALDGIASVLIGSLMGTVAVGLIYQSKTLLVGETVNDEVLDGIRGLLREEGAEEVVELKTMHLSPRDALVNLKVRFRPDLSVPALAGCPRAGATS